MRKTGWIGLLLCLTLVATGCLGGSGGAGNGTEPEAGGAAPAAGQSAKGPAGRGGDAEGAGDAVWKPYKPGKGKDVLRVMYVNEQTFYRDYGNLFQSKYPNVEFQVISLSETRGEGDLIENYDAVLKDRNPDVLLLNEAQYEGLAKLGKLLALDIPIRQSDFQLDRLMPGVAELLRARGDGRLYGLAPEFTTSVLYYNKKLFDAHGIEYPSDGMSWEAVLALASRFPDKGGDGQPFYGLFQPAFTSNPFDLVYRAGRADGLTLFDPAGENVLLDTDGWRNVFGRVVEAYRSGAVNGPKAPLRDNGDGTFSMSLGPGISPFAKGQAAMAIDGLLTYELLRMMGGTGQIADDDWDAVTVPVNPRRPDVAADFGLNDIYAVHAGSSNPSLAWAFISFVHDEQTMRLLSRSTSRLLTRPGLAASGDGRLEAFYRLKPDPSQPQPLVPAGYSAAFQKLAAEETAAAVGGEDAGEVLARMARRAQEELDRLSAESGRELFDLSADASLRKKQ